MVDQPLRTRVDAPATLPVPVDADGLRWRPATRADAAGLARLHSAMDPLDHPHFVVNEEEIAEDFAEPRFDPVADSLLAEDEKGIAAYGMALPLESRESIVRVVFLGGVRPDRRGEGLGRRIAAWQEARGTQQLAAAEEALPGWLLIYADTEHGGAAIRLFERRGFDRERYFLELRRDLGEPIPEVVPGDGVRIVPWHGDWSAGALEAKNASFRDHWGSQPESREHWENHQRLAIFRADLSYLALATGEDGTERVVGLVRTDVNEQDWAAQGYPHAYVGLVGVVREWRGRRIAQALLSRVLAASKDLGYERVNLDVDSDNPSGALGLYTSMGFRRATQSVALLKAF
ncbi:GNAT family N-acetyltransferase [Planctomonas deserti]|uniref:GNAT family N-acetyltransferase n=1 Tax=Planctomonas deserti TaxID=2144185 RepID=UPI000D3B2D35|nr:GNAT family N-acetyltransferase [Planctomonas deserti]